MKVQQEVIQILESLTKVKEFIKINIKNSEREFLRAFPLILFELRKLGYKADTNTHNNNVELIIYKK
tara:strand:- start:627 stop:827 length:201 start_codon:yes stop_codon:yes gene_type:complete